jgi:hypothetical protein
MVVLAGTAMDLPKNWDWNLGDLNWFEHLPNHEKWERETWPKILARYGEEAA